MSSLCSAVELAIRWGSTITPLSLPADSLSYESLHAAVAALSLHPALPSRFQLGYLDDERDFVRISTDEELLLLLSESERRLALQHRLIVEVMRDASDSDDGDEHDSDSFVKVEEADFSPQPTSPLSPSATAAAAVTAAARHDGPNWPSPLPVVQPLSPSFSSRPSSQPAAVVEATETAQADVHEEKKQAGMPVERQEARPAAAQATTVSSSPAVTASSTRSPVRFPRRAPLPVAAPVAGEDNWRAAAALLCRLLQNLSYCVAVALPFVLKHRQRLTLRRVVKKSVRIVVVGALLFCCLQSYFGTRRQLSALQQHVRSQYRTIAAHTQELSELSLLSYKDWIGMLDSERAVLADTREEVNALRLQLQTQQEIIRGMQAQLDADRADRTDLKDAVPAHRLQEKEASAGRLWSKPVSDKVHDGVQRGWDEEARYAELQRAERQRRKSEWLSRDMLDDIEALYGAPATTRDSSSDDSESQLGKLFSAGKVQAPAAFPAIYSSFASSSASAGGSSSHSQSRASSGSSAVQAAPWFSGRAGKKGKAGSSSSSSCSSSPSSSSCSRHHHDGDDDHSEQLEPLSRLHQKHAKHMGRMSKKIGKAVQHVSDAAKRVWKTLF